MNHFYFEQWNTIRWKSLDFKHLQELRNITASCRSNTPLGCSAKCFHGPRSLGRRVSWLFIPTKFLRERNCCLAQGQLLPGITTTFYGLYLHHTGEWLVPRGYHTPCISYEWKVFLSEVLFSSIISSLSWGQWQTNITMETTALLARTQEENLCSSHQENKTCLIN